MSERKSEIKRKIHNVKEWLDSADDSFEQDHEVKGQLNLLMAQAEMQTLKKANKNWYREYRIHITFAVLILVIVTGVVYNSFTKDKKVDTIIKSTSQSYENPKPKIEQEHNNSSSFNHKKADVQADTNPIQIEQGALEHTKTLTETEKRELVRKAQQSLHGELKR